MANDISASTASILGGGGGGKKVGGSVDKAIAQSVAKISKTNQQWAKSAATDIASGAHHSNWFSKILETIDLPRAAVVASLNQVFHPGANFGEDISHHIGAGDLLANGDKAKGSELWLRRGLGFLGDVAFDPLTYATFGEGKAAELGAEGVYRTVGELAAKKEVPEITADTFARVLKKGSAGLNDTERAVLAEHGMKPGGIAFRVPLTKTAEHLGVGEAKYLPLVPHGITDPLTIGKTKLFNILKDSKVGEAIGEKFGRLPEINTPLFKRVLRNGTPQEALEAFHVLQAAPVLRDIPRGIEQQFMPKLAESLKGIGSEHMDDLRNALEGDAQATARLVKSGVDPAPIRDVLDNVHAAAKAEGLPIGKIEDYFPHQLTQAARKVVQSGEPLPSTRIAAEFARVLRPGEKFLGQELKTASKDEIDSIGREVLGDKYVELFKGNPREVLPAYVRAVARRTGEAAFAKRLTESGVVTEGLNRSTVKLARDSADQLAAHDAASVAREGTFANPEAQELAHPTVVQRGTTLVQDALKRLESEAPETKMTVLGEHTGSSLMLKDAPQFVDDGLKIVREWAKPTGMQKALRTYDKYLSLWKSYELLGPGKALRHQIAALWGANLGNVSVDNMARYLKLSRRAAKDGLEELSAEDRAIFSEMQRRGVLHRTVTGDDFAAPDAGIKATARTKANPLSNQFLPIQKNWEWQGRAQDVVRGAMFYDAMKKGLSADMAAQKVKTFLFNASELSPFETKVMRRLVPFYCADPETEVLSRRGWLTYDKVRIGDEILTLNTATGTSEWQEVDRVFLEENYEGPMVSLESREMSALVTPDHRWPVSTNRNRGKAPFRLVQTTDLTTSDVIPLARQLDYWQEPAPQYKDEFVELVGWIVTEGHYKKHKNSPNASTIEISQSHVANPEKCVRIKRTLDALGARYHVFDAGVDRRIRYYGVTGEYARQIREMFPDKTLTMEFITSLTDDQRRLLVEVMILADGSRAITNKQAGTELITYGTSKEVEVGLFQALCALSGLTTHAHANWNQRYSDKPQHTVNVKKRTDCQPRNCHPTEVEYRGIIWCPHTKNETFFARRRGRVYFTGNTFMRTQFPLQLEQLARQPGKFTTFLHAADNLQLGVPEPEGPVPQYLQDTMSIRLPFKFQGQQAYVSPDLPFARLGELFSGGGAFGPLPTTGPLSIEKVIANASPLIKNPLEGWANKQAWSDVPFTDKANAVPGTWTKVPGLMQVLDQLNLVDRAKADFTTPNGTKVKKGDYVITDRRAYQLEGILPPLAQSRRILPEKEPNFEARESSSRLAYLLGQNFRTLTPASQQGELLRRQAKLQALIKRLQNVGAMPRKR